MEKKWRGGKAWGQSWGARRGAERRRPSRLAAAAGAGGGGAPRPPRPVPSRPAPLSRPRGGRRGGPRGAPALRAPRRAPPTAPRAPIKGPGGSAGMPGSPHLAAVAVRSEVDLGFGEPRGGFSVLPASCEERAESGACHLAARRSPRFLFLFLVHRSPKAPLRKR